MTTGSPQAGTASPATSTRTRSSRRLPPRWRDLLLTVHIVVAVGVLGTDLVLLTLATTALASRDPELVRASYLAMGLLGEAVLLPLALAAPLTGILLGLGTAWGLARHWWVLTKLVLTIAVATAAVFVLRPALDRAAAQALQVPLAELPTTGIGRLGVAVTLAPAGALLVLVAIVTLAVFSPGARPGSGAADPAPGSVARRRRVDAEAARLVGAGATRLRVSDQGATDRYLVVMQDPEGNQFCLT